MAIGDNRRSITPAEYTPGRDANGHFTKGNKIGEGNKSHELGRLKEMLAVFATCFDAAKMEAVTDSIYNLAIGAKSEDIRLKAGIYLQDRAIGKVKETVEVEGGNNTQINFNLLTADEISVLRPLLPKLLGKAQAPLIIDVSETDEVMIDQVLPSS